MSCLLDAVSKLRMNAVPEIDGAYNCYLDPVSSRQLFCGSTTSGSCSRGRRAQTRCSDQGMVNDFLGLQVRADHGGICAGASDVGRWRLMRRPIVVGKGALIEGDFDGMVSPDVAPTDSIVSLVDGVAMVTREPIDRLQQIIAQSWYWIGGFCAPSDTMTNPSVVPTATNAAFKRAVMIEHLG